MNKRLFDENGRLFGKISVMDVLAVLLVAVLAIMMVSRFSTEETRTVATNGGTSEFDYVICVKQIRMETVNAFKEGDVVRLGGSTTVIGRVAGVEYEQFISNVNTLDGRVANVPMEGYYDLYLTVHTTGTVTDGRYYANRLYELCLNANVSIETRYIAVTGSVVSLG